MMIDRTCLPQLTKEIVPPDANQRAEGVVEAMALDPQCRQVGAAGNLIGPMDMAAAPATSNSTTYTISATQCPQVLCRLLGLFAQRDILTGGVNATGARGTLRVTITVPDLDAHRATIIAEKMRQLVSVRFVTLSLR